MAAPNLQPGGEDLFTVQEVAALARVSPRTIEREISAGRLRAMKIAGRTVRIPNSEYLKWVKRSLQ